MSPSGLNGDTHTCTYKIAMERERDTRIHGGGEEMFVKDEEVNERRANRYAILHDGWKV